MDELASGQSFQDKDTSEEEEEEDRTQVIYRVVSADPITREVFVPGETRVVEVERLIEPALPPRKTYFKRVGGAIIQVGT